MAHPRGAGIQDLIRHDIITGAFPLGTRLQIDALAVRYGVSHMPVREALRELRGEGLVTIEVNRGARVRELDAGFVENVFDVRNALETLMARRAADSRTVADVAAMRSAEHRFEQAVAARAPRDVLLANRELHDAIYLASGNQEAFKLFKQHWMLITTLFDSYGFDDDRMLGEIREHAYMIHAIESGDGPAAAAVMTTHIEKAKRDLLRRMMKGG